MFKWKLPKQEQGFTLVEVLVAILIATIFVTIAMQMMAIAAVFKVRAQEYAEATTWIQEDIENVKYTAANYQYTSLTTTASSGSSVLQVASVNDFTAADTLSVGTDTTNNTIAAAPLGINTTTKIVTLTAPLGTNWLTDTPVVATTRCTPAAGALNVGFADGLRDKITDTPDPTVSDVDDSNDEGTVGFVDIPKTSKVFKNKTFNLKRTTTIKDVRPYNVLEIRYEVFPTSSLGGAVSGASLANFYTEVIPNAAFQCP